MTECKTQTPEENKPTEKSDSDNIQAMLCAINQNVMPTEIPVVEIVQTVKPDVPTENAPIIKAENIAVNNSVNNGGQALNNAQQANLTQQPVTQTLVASDVIVNNTQQSISQTVNKFNDDINTLKGTTQVDLTHNETVEQVAVNNSLKSIPIKQDEPEILQQDNTNILGEKVNLVKEYNVSTHNEEVTGSVEKLLIEETVGIKSKTNETGRDIQSQGEFSKNITFVKITDASSKLDVSPSQQIAQNVKTNLNNGKSEFIMHLSPENLGKVSVKLVAQNGILTVELIAQNPKTQNLLLANASEIKELVQASTNSTTHVVASNQNESMQQNYTQQESQKQDSSRQRQQHEAQLNETKENDEVDMIDFMSALKQLNMNSRINRVVV